MNDPISVAMTAPSTRMAVVVPHISKSNKSDEPDRATSRILHVVAIQSLVNQDGETETQLMIWDDSEDDLLTLEQVKAKYLLIDVVFCPWLMDLDQDRLSLEMGWAKSRAQKQIDSKK